MRVQALLYWAICGRYDAVIDAVQNVASLWRILCFVLLENNRLKQQHDDTDVFMQVCVVIV